MTEKIKDPLNNMVQKDQFCHKKLIQITHDNGSLNEKKMTLLCLENSLQINSCFIA